MEEFSPYDIFEELKKNNLDPSVFSSLDERQFPPAPNFLEFCIGPQFLNTRILPKQIEVGSKLFLDYCPRCSAPGYIDRLFDQSIGNIKDNVAFLERGVCPKCKATRWELVDSKELVWRNECAIAAGQRGGKSKLVGLLANYVLHRLLKIPNPLAFFNQPSGEILVGTFAGLTLDRSYKNLWIPFKGFMDSSPWFQHYHKYLKDEGKKLGVELFHELKDSITYSCKQLHFHTMGSESRKARGDSRVFSACDEVGWMLADKNDSTFMNADELYTALSNSLVTMRTKRRKIWSPDNFDMPPMLMCNVSSPSSAKDKIMRLYKDSKKNSRILGMNIPSWEMNPDFTYGSLREEFSHMDEKTFMRDFGAEPPIAANPFVDDPRLVDKIASGEPFEGFSVAERIEKDGSGDSYKTLEFRLGKADRLTPRMAAFDLGFKKNDLAICLFSIDEDGRPRLDFAVSVHPEPDCRINIASIFENFTRPLVENFKIKHAFFDRWNSLDQVERLKIMEVDAKMHSLTYKEFDSVRGTIFSQAVRIPALRKSMMDYVKEYKENDSASIGDAAAQLGIQLLTVRDLGHKVIKPLMGNDDIFRAFCLGVVNLSDPAVKKQYQNVVQLNTQHRVAHLGTIRIRRHGGAGGPSSMGSMEGDNGLPLGSVRSRRRS
jgi:hypothetical protein